MLGRMLTCLFLMFSVYMASLRTLFLTMGSILSLPGVVGVQHGCGTLRHFLCRLRTANHQTIWQSLSRDEWRSSMINQQSSIINQR
jgi:predicted transcriptional regulator